MQEFQWSKYDYLSDDWEKAKNQIKQILVEQARRHQNSYVW